MVNVLSSLHTLSAFTICSELAKAEVVPTSSTQTSMLAMTIMARYREQCTAVMPKMPPRATKAHQLYCVFRQATTFAQLVKAFSACTESIAMPSEDEDAAPRRLRPRSTDSAAEKKEKEPIDMDDILLVQEHFEAILVKIFKETEVPPHLERERAVLVAETEVDNTTSIMQSMINAVKSQMTVPNAMAVAFWTLKTLSGNRAGQHIPTVNDIAGIMVEEVAAGEEDNTQAVMAPEPKRRRANPSSSSTGPRD
jgi:hypothetical protein